MIARRGWWLGAVTTILCSLAATAVTGSLSSSISARPLTVVVATADALLLYALAARQFEQPVIGWAAAVLLLFTPAHAYFVRTGSPRALLPVPLLLGGALLLSAYQSELREAARRSRRTLPARAIVGGAIGLCGISMTLLIVPIGSIRTVAWQRAATVADWFWTFFLPSNLFVKAEPLPSCGLFLAAAAVPMAVGVYTIVREALDDPWAARVESLIVLGGSIAAPFGAAVTGVPPLISRALVVIPLGVLLSISGSLVMWNRWGLAGRVAVVTLWIGGAVQAVVCQP